MFNRHAARAEGHGGAHSTLICIRCIASCIYIYIEATLSLSYCKTGTTGSPLCASHTGVIEVYMHNKDNPSCIATLCMRRPHMHNRDDSSCIRRVWSRESMSQMGEKYSRVEPRSGFSRFSCAPRAIAANEPSDIGRVRIRFGNKCVGEREREREIWLLLRQATTYRSRRLGPDLLYRDTRSEHR